MDYLPIFINLRDKHVLVVGGGKVAARKIKQLIPTGAIIYVVAPVLQNSLQQLVSQNQIHWLAQTFDDSLLENKILVIAATHDKNINQLVSQKALEKSCLVNVVDNPSLCSFIFPAIIDRSPLLIAISSAGKAPVLARQLREKIEAMLSPRLGRVADIAGRWRHQVKAKWHDIKMRRRFWEFIFTSRFVSLIENGQEKQAETYLLQQLEQADKQQSGEVILVGAGPGDAGLLTLNGLHAIQRADIILYDSLVNPQILSFARKESDLICVGKRAGNHSVIQSETNRLLVGYAKQGKCVVRLKGGDPFIFGRGGEEINVLRQHKIAYQAIPGITAALGSCAYAGIPITYRNISRGVTFVTGHCSDEQAALHWSSIAKLPHTVIIYMGVMKAGYIQQQLINHGKDPSTPIAIISNGTCDGQQTHIGCLTELTELAKHAASPALLVIGEVVKMSEELAWFAQVADVA